ncbi:MAG: hypothetical protein NTU88_13080, partial [Armatimonadetes bacterium]|nr:hypothetical protein [Armatimonadota bacterium]
RWVTLFVLNTGGKALEWFHTTCCRDLSADEFYEDYVPRVIEDFFRSPRIDEREVELPAYSPFLAGSRYSLERLKAGFDGITLETRREDLLMSVLRGNALYHGRHLQEIAAMVPLRRTVTTSGGGAKIRGLLDVKRRWTGDFDYHYRDQSSLLGAAMLGQAYLSGKGFPGTTPRVMA